MKYLILSCHRLWQHHANPLHLYCRMRDMGLNATLAVKMTTMYERYLYKRS